MAALIDHSWVVLLVITWVSGLRWWRRSREHIARDPSLAPGYRWLIPAYFVFGTLPWLVMGMGLVIGDAGSFQAYFQPRQAGLWVWLWYLTVLALAVLWIWWIFMHRGAEALAEHPGLPGMLGSDAGAIKIHAALGFGGGILFLCVVYGLDLLSEGSTKVHEDGYTTVFVVYDAFWQTVGMALFTVAVGFVVLGIAILWRRRWIAAGRPKTKRGSPGLMFVWCGLWFAFCVVAWPIALCSSYEYVSVYRDGHAQVAEGLVQVVSMGPTKGGWKQDAVEIGEARLLVGRRNLSTPVYAQSIKEGGVLREGVAARVWHHDGRILRVDVRDGG